MKIDNYRLIADGLMPLSRLSQPKEVIRQFTPNWFAATMGTGILAIALSALPHKHESIYSIGESLWKFNIALFLTFLFLYSARWLLYFNEARRIFRHSVVSMFFGCIPMGLSTIINGFVIYGPNILGETANIIALNLWYVDAVLAIACGVAIPFMMFTHQQHAIEKMTAVWLLPVVASEVAAVSAGMIAPKIADSHDQLIVLISGFVLWACSVPLAMSILSILLLRMILHKLPEAGMAATSWLSLGPIGTGALALLTLGEATPNIFESNGLEIFIPGIQGFYFIAVILLWGYGLWWLLIATAITIRHFQGHVPFNLGWWGYTFPLGVYAVTTLRIYKVMPIEAFAIIGGSLTAVLSVLWLIVGSRTIRGAWQGDLFVSPCLKDLVQEPQPSMNTSLDE